MRDLDDRSEKTILWNSRGATNMAIQARLSASQQAFAEHAAILYVDVAFEESLQKNRARFNPDKTRQHLTSTPER